jgi:hypothetical protein
LATCPGIAAPLRPSLYKTDESESVNTTTVISFDELMPMLGITCRVRHASSYHRSITTHDDRHVQRSWSPSMNPGILYLFLLPSLRNRY